MPYLDPAWFEDRGATFPKAAPRGPRGRSVLHEQLEQDLRRDVIPHLLRYEDTNSMLHSIESRVPFLTPALAEFCLGLPQEYLVDDRGTGKAVLRAAMRGVAPDAVLDRTDKIGFQPPQALWFGQMTDAERDRRRSRVADILPFVRPDGLSRLWADARQDGAAAEGAWRSMFLAEWVDQHGVKW